MVLVLSLLVGLTGGFALLGLPPVIDLLFNLYGLSYGGMSVLLSSLLWSHAAMQLPGGVILDRLGLRRSMALSLSLILIGSLLAALKPVFGLALAGRVVTGFGTGLSFIGTMKLIAYNFPARRVGIIQGFFGGLFSGGSILAFYFLPDLAALNWRWIFFAPALLAALCLVMLALARLAPENRGGFEPMPLRKIMGMPSVWAIAGLHAFSYGSVINLANWAASVMVETSGVTRADQFAWVGMLVLFISAISRFSGGFLLVWLDSLKLGLVTVGMIALAYLGLFFAPIPGWVVGLAAFICLVGSINFGALWAMATKLAPPESMGSVFGSINLLSNLGAVLFTVMLGSFKDVTGSFRPGFLPMAVGAALCVLVGAKVLTKTGKK